MESPFKQNPLSIKPTLMRSLILNEPSFWLAVLVMMCMQMSCHLKNLASRKDNVIRSIDFSRMPTSKPIFSRIVHSSCIQLIQYEFQISEMCSGYLPRGKEKKYTIKQLAVLALMRFYELWWYNELFQRGMNEVIDVVYW